MYRQFWIWFSEENMISEMQFLPSLSRSDHLVCYLILTVLYSQNLTLLLRNWIYSKGIINQ